MVRRNARLLISALVVLTFLYYLFKDDGDKSNSTDSLNDLHTRHLDEDAGEDSFDYDKVNQTEEDYGPEDKTKKKRFPTVLIIGSQKSGTTTLLKFLLFHPTLVGPHRELHYFDKQANGKNYELYLRQMPKSWQHQITIEKTPNYLTKVESAERVLKYQQHLGVDLKLILIVRDPIRRSISHAFHTKAHHRIDLKNLTSEVIADNSIYIRSSLYGEHFQRWLNYFRRDQFLILDGEKFAKENPTSTLRQVEDFLGIMHVFKEDDFGFNEDKGFYCYNPTDYCFPKHRGHSSYPQKLTPAGKEILTGVFEKDLEKFWHLSGVNYNWVLGADV